MGFQTAIGRGQITAVSHATDQPNIPTTTKVERGAWMTLGDHGLILQVSHSDLEQLMALSTLQQAKREANSMWPAEKPWNVTVGKQGKIILLLSILKVPK